MGQINASGSLGHIFGKSTNEFVIDGGAYWGGQLLAEFDWKKLNFEFGPYYKFSKIETTVSKQTEEEMGAGLSVKFNF